MDVNGLATKLLSSDVLILRSSMHCMCGVGMYGVGFNR